MKCPKCEKEIEAYFEADTATPFTSKNPYDGLIIWGPYSAQKEVICEVPGFIHFRFADLEDRLVKLLGR